MSNDVRSMKTGLIYLWFFAHLMPISLYPFDLDDIVWWVIATILTTKNEVSTAKNWNLKSCKRHINDQVRVWMPTKDHVKNASSR